MKIRIVLTIFSLYICHQISLIESLQVPDKLWEIKRCSPILNGYEYKNIVVDKIGVKRTDNIVSCWYSCSYMGECQLRLEEPKIYGMMVRFINFFVMSANFLILYIL